MVSAMFALLACQKSGAEKELEEPEMGGLQIEITAEAETKATAYTAEQTCEKQINTLQILTFLGTGASAHLATYNYYDGLSVTSGSYSVPSIALAPGTYTVYAVVNWPTPLTNVKTLEALEAEAVDLSANSLKPNEGFVMAGKSGTVTVNSGANSPASISVSRLVSRVALATVSNKVPVAHGSIEVKGVFLSNVVGNQNVAGNAAISTWYNKMGRVDERTIVEEHMINGTTYLASCPKLTYVGCNKTVANAASEEMNLCTYGFPNPTATDVTGYATTMSPRYTRLVVMAVFDGKEYYYPVKLPQIERNTAYTVDLTITGIGSTDPDVPVVKGNMSATITVASWATGTVYEETI